jgi:hypothetical protein
LTGAPHACDESTNVYSSGQADKAACYALRDVSGNDTIDLSGAQGDFRARRAISELDRVWSSRRK